MPVDNIILNRSAQKQLNKLPLQVHKRIIESFSRIKDNPLIGPKLPGELGDYYKLRVGDYRVVYSFNLKKSLVEVVRIEHRQGVYK